VEEGNRKPSRPLNCGRGVVKAEFSRDAADTVSCKAKAGSPVGSRSEARVVIKHCFSTNAYSWELLTFCVPKNAGAEPLSVRLAPEIARSNEKTCSSMLWFTKLRKDIAKTLVVVGSTKLVLYLEVAIVLSLDVGAWSGACCWSWAWARVGVLARLEVAFNRDLCDSVVRCCLSPETAVNSLSHTTHVRARIGAPHASLTCTSRC